MAYILRLIFLQLFVLFSLSNSFFSSLRPKNEGALDQKTKAMSIQWKGPSYKRHCSLFLSYSTLLSRRLGDIPFSNITVQCSCGNHLSKGSCTVQIITREHPGGFIALICVPMPQFPFRCSWVALNDSVLSSAGSTQSLSCVPICLTAWAPPFSFSWLPLQGPSKAFFVH